MLLLSLFLAASTLCEAVVEFRIKNNDGGDVWIGIQGNEGHIALGNGGFVLQSGGEVRNLRNVSLLPKNFLSEIRLRS